MRALPRTLLKCLISIFLLLFVMSIKAVAFDIDQTSPELVPVGWSLRNEKAEWFNFDETEFHLVEDPQVDNQSPRPRFARVNTFKAVTLFAVTPSFWCSNRWFDGYFCKTFEVVERREVTEMPEAVFLSQLRKAQIAVVVHGYATSLDDNTKSMTRLVANARGPEKFILYRWPSAASVIHVQNDTVQAQNSDQNLAELIRKLVTITSPGKVNLVGHSMGARVLLQLALINKSICLVPRCLGKLVFFNPNVLISEYKRLRTEPIFSGIALYVHRRDSIVDGAEKLEPGKLISQFRNGVPFVDYDLETIDMTLALWDVDSEGAHSGWYSNSEVVQDLEEVLGFKSRLFQPTYEMVEDADRKLDWREAEATGGATQRGLKYRILRADRRATRR